LIKKKIPLKMQNIALLLTLLPLSVAAIGKSPAPVVATNAEKANGFSDLNECQAALEGSRKSGHGGAAGTPSGLTGSMFNRARGNVSRCEIFHGEAVIVVYPRGQAPRTDAGTC
jgi:hypothetical protein